MILDDFLESLFSGISALLVTAVLLAGIFYLAKLECSQRWENSGMEYEYGVIQGCVIQLKDGRWVPAENYREL